MTDKATASKCTEEVSYYLRSSKTHPRYFEEGEIRLYLGIKSTCESTPRPPRVRMSSFPIVSVFSKPASSANPISQPFVLCWMDAEKIKSSDKEFVIEEHTDPAKIEASTVTLEELGSLGYVNNIPADKAMATYRAICY